MIYEGSAVLEMFKDKFSDIIITELLVATYTKIYAQLPALVKPVFDANYTLDEDFYILDSDVTEINREIIKTNVMLYRYNSWSIGFPDAESDILFAIYNKQYGDNTENEYKTYMKAIHIFANKESYNELEIIAEKIKSIQVFDNIDISERTYYGIIFKEVISSGFATKLEGTYQVEMFDKLYYPVEIIFDIVYYK
jgi:hypothetical protein